MTLVFRKPFGIAWENRESVFGEHVFVDHSSNLAGEAQEWRVSLVADETASFCELGWK